MDINKEFEYLIESCLSDIDRCETDRLRELMELSLDKKLDAMMVDYGRRYLLKNKPSVQLILFAAIILEDHETASKVWDIRTKEEAEAYSFQRDELLISRNTRGPIVSTERLIGLDLNLHHDKSVFVEKVQKTIPINDLKHIDAAMVHFSKLVGGEYYSNWAVD